MNVGRLTYTVCSFLVVHTSWTVICHTVLSKNSRRLSTSVCAKLSTTYEQRVGVDEIIRQIGRCLSAFVFFLRLADWTPMTSQSLLMNRNSSTENTMLDSGERITGFSAESNDE